MRALHEERQNEQADNRRDETRENLQINLQD